MMRDCLRPTFRRTSSTHAKSLAPIPQSTATMRQPSKKYPSRVGVPVTSTMRCSPISQQRVAKEQTAATTQGMSRGASTSRL